MQYLFTEQGSSASQMTVAKIMDIISRLPGCDGQAADAVSAYTQVKMEDAHKLLKIPKSECPDIWIRLPRHKWPKSWSSMEDPVVPLEQNLYGHPLAGLLWERQLQKVQLEHGWEKAPNWECLFVNREKDYSCLCMWRTSNSVERNRTFIGLGKSSWRCWFGRTNIIPWLHLLGLHSKRMKNQQRYCWQFSTISAGATGKLPARWDLMRTYLHGPMTWEVMQRSTWKDIANWRTKPPSNRIKFQLHALMTVNSKKKSGDLCENCQKFALKSS